MIQESKEDPLSAIVYGFMPWEHPDLRDWSIAGMNHYDIDGVKHIFVAMTKDGLCIQAEGTSTEQVFNALRARARKLADVSDQVRNRFMVLKDKSSHSPEHDDKLWTDFLLLLQHRGIIV